MKRNILILLSILIAGSLFAQKAPTTKLISSSEESIVVQFDLNGYSTAKVMTPQGEQFIVNVPDMAPMLEAGCPNLPTFPIPAIIGDRAEMTVNVIDAQYTDYANMSIAPSKGNISRQINPDDVPYTYGEMYQQDAFWPASQAYLEAPYILRDFRGQNIMVRPFAYNPITKTLRVYTHMTIAMTKVSDNGQNQKVTRRSSAIKTSPEFKSSYNRRYINFSAAEAKYPFVEDAGEMLVICADQFLAGMEEFVAWKNQSGRPTTLVSVTEVGGNNTDVIKNYISNLYNNQEHNLIYVLLVGDYEHITPQPFQYNDGTSPTQYSDIWFGQLEGNDNYPEVFVGRFSVQTDAHLANHVNKVLYYERDMPGDITWGNQGLGIGSTHEGSGGHFGEYDNLHIDFIRDTLLHYTYTDVTDLHQGGTGASNATATGISNVVNQGVSIINYCNHGSETSWGVANYSTSNVNALTNDNMWPIVWSVACLNGKFNYGGANGECFAEAWMRATDNSTGAPTGAIGGMFSWMSQPWQPPMFGQDEMVDVLTEWRNSDLYNHTLAGASMNGNMYVLDMGGSLGTPTHNSWILFGDPSLMVRTDNPVEMNVSASPAVLMVGMTELNISAQTDYGIATLSKNGEVIASGRVINGECNLTFPPLSDVGTADLVVIGYNKVTYIGTIEVIVAEGAYITMDNYQLNVDQANYGETIDMNINIKNVGVEAASNLTATLTSSSEYVEILSGEGSVANMNPDEIVTLEGFQFSVAENVPDKTNAEFTLTVTDGTNIWEKAFNIQLHAPVIVFESIQKYTGPNDEYFLDFNFKNTGTAPVYGGTLNIYSSSLDIVFDAAHIVLEDTIAASESVTIPTTYTVAETVEPGSTFEISYEMTSGLNTVSGLYVLTYGAIQEDFESGVFGEDWTFSAQYPWSIITGGSKGNYCASSSNSGVSSSESSMTLTVDVLAAGELTFMYKVSSESGWDKLYFYMDNQEKGNWSGTVNWTQFVQPVTVGTHTFKWSYTKDGSVNSGDDRAWVDDIVFPPVNVVSFLEPVTEVQVEVNDTEVTLSWQPGDRASSYIILRDGEEVGRVSETTFTEIVGYGSYQYAVIATDDNGGCSMPVSNKVDVIDYTGIEETSLSCQVYPNPVNSTLYIKGIDTTYRYALYNNMGQQVVNGQAQGLKQIDVTSLAKGVYFLRITTGTPVNVQKVVVE